MKFITNLTGSIVDLHCFNNDGMLKDLSLKIYDLETNFKIVEFKFQLLDYLHVWNVVPMTEKLIGFKVKVFSDDLDMPFFLVWEDIILKNSICKTKFSTDKLDTPINFALFHNLIETLQIYKDDYFDLKNSNQIIDLGSSVGIFTAYALEYNPNIKSVNVEMNTNFHNVCVETFKDNSNIIPINAAIYKESNQVIEINSIRDNFNDLGNTIAGKLYSDQVYKTTINTISLNDIIRNYNIDKIDMLKVDIEGYEYELFENIDDDILNRVDKIFLEFHLVFDKERKMNLINRLIRMGYKMTMLFPVDIYNENMFSIYFKK